MEVILTLRWICIWSSLINSVMSFSIISKDPQSTYYVNLTEAEVSLSGQKDLSFEEIDDSYADTSVYGNETFFPPEGRLIDVTSLLAAFNQFPYAVHVTAKIPGDTAATGRVCTGALLTASYVITLAACVFDATAITVAAATLTNAELVPSPTLLVTISGTAIIHPKYAVNNYYYNVALIKLASPYTLGINIGTINLAYKFNSDEHKDVVGRAMRVIGFGDITANMPTAWVLRYASMNVLSKFKCAELLKERNTIPTSIHECLGTDSGTVGACNQADMGGLIVYKFDNDATATLVGLLNYYYTCKTDTPNMFIRLGPHWDWIRRYVKVYDNIG